MVGGKLSSEICYSSFGYPQGANKHLAKDIHPAGLPERLFGWRVLTSIAKGLSLPRGWFRCVCGAVLVLTILAEIDIAFKIRS